MLRESEKAFFEQVLLSGLGSALKIQQIQHVSGGDINHASKIFTSDSIYFIKWNHFPQIDLFEKEAAGLKLLSKAQCIDVVQPLAFGNIEGRYYLILENIEKGNHSRHFWEDFGRSLARMHRVSASHFGLDYSNYIGKLPQDNQPNADWTNFFVERRILPQLEMARNKGIINRQLAAQFESIFPKLTNIFPKEKPSLLHGDLWSGNFLCGPNQSAWLIDPAVYFGHREMEISFTRLFGGFDARFYKSYAEENPLSPNLEERIDLYNLYPLLVHVNLFGTSYLSGIVSTLARFAD